MPILAAAPVVPAGVQYYVPVVINNNQSASTAAPFQQMINLSSTTYEQYEAPNMQNVEFFYSNGTVIPSWLEGNPVNPLQTSNLYKDAHTEYWLNIAQHIQANTGLVIYMGFAANTVSLLNGKTVGEAAWLSANYSQYDNGARVFLAYFNGATPPSEFSMAPGFGINTQDEPYGSAVVPTIHMFGSAYGNNVYFTFNKQIPNQLVIVQTNFQTQNLYADTGVIGLVGGLSSSSDIEFSYIGPINQNLPQPYGSYEVPLTINVSGEWLYATMYYMQKNGFYAYRSGTPTATCRCQVLGENPLFGDLYFYLGSAAYMNTSNYAANPVDILFNYGLVRAYPPNGVMPSLQFGSLSATPTTSTTVPSTSTTTIPITSTPPPSTNVLLSLVTIVLALCAIIIALRKFKIAGAHRR